MDWCECLGTLMLGGRKGKVDSLSLPVDVGYSDLNGASESNKSPRVAVSNLLLAEIEMI